MRRENYTVSILCSPHTRQTGKYPSFGPSQRVPAILSVRVAPYTIKDVSVVFS